MADLRAAWRAQEITVRSPAIGAHQQEGTRGGDVLAGDARARFSHTSECFAARFFLKIEYRMRFVGAGWLAVLLGIIAGSSFILSLSFFVLAPAVHQPPSTRIVFFSVPMPLATSPGVREIQRFAVASWALVPGAVVVLFLENQADCAAWRKINAAVLCFPVRCVDHTSRKPVLACVWSDLYAATDSQTLVFINADVVLAKGLETSIHQANLLADSRQYVIVGQRTDANLSVLRGRQVTAGTLAELASWAAYQPLHGRWGLDYFVLGNGIRPRLEDRFVAGIVTWDNTLLWQLLQQGVLSVDASHAIAAIHIAREEGLGYSHTIAGADGMRSFAANLTKGCYSYGSTVNAAFVVDPYMKPNLRVELEFLLSARADSSRVVYLLPLNSIPDLVPFKCENHLYVTGDEGLLMQARVKGFWVFFRPSLRASYASEFYWQLVSRILQKNYSVILTDASYSTTCHTLNTRGDSAVSFSHRMLPVYLPAKASTHIPLFMMKCLRTEQSFSSCFETLRRSKLVTENSR